ncbi:MULTISPECIES: hypothetical protein [unclassified Luteococcus]|uniref:hypothetical protein n=1 Tax=unclassified Luteococcus TaxID=2639923 RepID=UPI00313EA565
MQRIVLLGGDPELIARESARDGSSAGELAALTAGAAVGTGEAKRRALAEVLTSRDAPAYRLAAISRGLFPAEQFELTQPLAAQWFARINRLSQWRQGWGLTGIIRAGLPLGHADDDTLTAAEEALNDPALDPTVGRALRDGLEQLSRQNRSWHAFG